MRVRSFVDLNAGNVNLSRKRGVASISFFTFASITVRAVLVSPYLESSLTLAALSVANYNLGAGGGPRGGAATERFSE